MEQTANRCLYLEMATMRNSTIVYNECVHHILVIGVNYYIEMCKYYRIIFIIIYLPK